MRHAKIEIVLGVVGISSALSCVWNDLCVPIRPEAKGPPAVLQVDTLDADIRKAIDSDRVDGTAVIERLEEISRDVKHLEAAALKHRQANDTAQYQGLTLSAAAEQMDGKLKELRGFHGSEEQRVAKLEKLIATHEGSVRKLAKENTGLRKDTKQLGSDLEDLRSKLRDVEEETVIMGEMRDIVIERKEGYKADERNQEQQRQKEKEEDRRRAKV